MAMIEPSQQPNKWREADPAMLILTLILVGFGLLSIFSADARDLSLTGALAKQAMFAVIGCVLMVLLALFDYRMWRLLSLPMYGAALILLALVLKIGEAIAGAQRWFVFGPVSFQPSEPAKLATIVLVAAFITMRGDHIRGPFSFAFSGVLAAIPAVLVFIEPDLGTALIFVAIWFGILALSRTRMLYLLACLVAIAPITWVAWNGILGVKPLFHQYQKDRITCFAHTDRDTLDFCANVVNARVTIGQAGWLGHRFADAAILNEQQSLAVSTSDFAFAHAIGNFGFIGAIALFTLFLLLIWRYLRVAQLARDEFGQLIAVGAATMLFFQAFVNIGMNVGILPVVGIPLPFISQGGTPLVAQLAMQGILQSILIHRHSLAFGRK